MFEGGRRLHVYADGTKRASTPAFANLQKALDVATPGDRILLHKGVHKGAFVVKKDGTREKPIVVMPAGDGPAVIEGIGAKQLFDIHQADYLWFHGLTFRDPNTGDGGHTVDGVVLLAGNRGHGFTPGCKGLTITHCTFKDFGTGVMGADGACRDFTILDNTFHGRQNWLAPKDLKGHHYRDYSWVAVWVAGAGHSIGYNYVRGFRDGINLAAGWGGGKDFKWRDKNVSIDIYNNDITEMGDDFIETDSGAHNIRVLRNRCSNTQICGISAQPTYGGPIYIIGNTLYNVPRGAPFKFNVHPAGLVVYHNTLAGEWRNNVGWSNSHFRNNLFMGAVQIRSLTTTSSMDHNGYAIMPVEIDHPRKRDGAYHSLPALNAALGWEGRGVQLGWKIFNKLETPKGKAKTYATDTQDFSLKIDSAAIDRGCVLPNVNDHSENIAPDLGAIEFGSTPPHYGPRPQKR